MQENIVTLRDNLKKYSISEASCDRNIRQISSLLDTRHLNEHAKENFGDNCIDATEEMVRCVGEGEEESIVSVRQGETEEDSERVVKGEGGEEGVGWRDSWERVTVMHEKKTDRPLLKNAEDKDREWLAISRQIMLDISK